MGIRMVRQPSEAPNISNNDDFVGLRYAYGDQNGFVKNKGNELSYTINGSAFTLKSGRVVLQGVESDIDANGESIAVDNIVGNRYFTIYYEVNLATNTTSIKSQSDTATYPSIPSGDNLSQNSAGTANLELYHFIANSGVISSVEKLVKPILYVNENTTVNNASNVTTKINGQSISFIFENNGTTVKNATNATNATNSTYAQYASTDTSKGTIEERLTYLGFKQGTITLTSPIGSSSATLLRQGNYVIFKVGAVSAPPGGVFVGNIPPEFRPKEKQENLYADSVGGQIAIWIYTDGRVYVNDTTPYPGNIVKLSLGWEANPL